MAGFGQHAVSESQVGQRLKFAEQTLCLAATPVASVDSPSLSCKVGVFEAQRGWVAVLRSLGTDGGLGLEPRLALSSLLHCFPARGDNPTFSGARGELGT